MLSFIHVSLKCTLTCVCKSVSFELLWCHFCFQLYGIIIFLQRTYINAKKYLTNSSNTFDVLKSQSDEIYIIFVDYYMNDRLIGVRNLGVYLIITIYIVIFVTILIGNRLYFLVFPVYVTDLVSIYRKADINVGIVRMWV